MALSENIKLLIEKFFKGEISPEEKIVLDEWYHSFDDSEVEWFATENDSEHQLGNRIHKRLIETIHEEESIDNRPRINWRRIIAVAAIVVSVMTVVSYFILFSESPQAKIVQVKPVEKIPTNEIIPGGNKALLTLEDGSTIILDSASTGTIIQQGNIKVQKLKNGLVAYLVNNKQVSPNDKAFYNTISTPRGGEYQVTLSDGTKVWLDAASSIRFPIIFTGNERKVFITGEAYFEVAKNEKMPFKVKAGHSEIEVLGTHFNVNAYEDEASIKTTLLEGKVKISAPLIAGNHSAKFLVPGQQADLNKAGNIKIIENADTEAAVAWMKGYFQFKSADLHSILRQISRWYDAEIVYDGNVNTHFTGQLNKNLDVLQLFKTLSLTNEVTFKTEGKKIIVSPKK